MVNSGEMLKSTFAALVLVVFVHSVSAAEKLASCCKSVNKQEITEPITGYMIQKPNPPCVRAVIFQTQAGLFCSQLTAPWVRRKIVAFEKAKAQATSASIVPSSTASLLSMLTSTASPSSSATTISSSSLPSSSSTPSSSSSLPSSSSTPSSSSLPSSSTPSSSSSLPSSSTPSSSSSLPATSTIFHPSSSSPSPASTSSLPAGETLSEDKDD